MFEISGRSPVKLLHSSKSIKNETEKKQYMRALGYFISGLEIKLVSKCKFLVEPDCKLKQGLVLKCLKSLCVLRPLLCAHFCAPTSVRPLWCVHFGAFTLVRPLWCVHFGIHFCASTFVHPVFASSLNLHQVHVQTCFSLLDIVRNYEVFWLDHIISFAGIVIYS